jgi:TPR repeat protein
LGKVIVLRRAGRGVAGVIGCGAMVLALGLGAAPALAQQGWDNPPAADSGRPKLQLNPYEQALRFKQQGNCVKAIELLEPIAASGHGFEIAQLNLGQCYIAVAETKADAEAKKKDRLTGIKWIIEAAQAGLAPAQEQLVRLTLTGGWVKIEPTEAGMWYLLWRRNPARTQLGASDLDPTLKQKLQTMLTAEDWAKASALADAWRKHVEPGEGPAP